MRAMVLWLWSFSLVVSSCAPTREGMALEEPFREFSLAAVSCIDDDDANGCTNGELRLPHVSLGTIKLICYDDTLSEGQAILSAEKVVTDDLGKYESAWSLELPTEASCSGINVTMEPAREVWHGDHVYCFIGAGFGVEPMSESADTNDPALRVIAQAMYGPCSGFKEQELHGRLESRN